MKKIIALVLVMVMCFSLGIGATVAFLTDRETETNVFTVGNVDIELNDEFEQESTLLPGVVLDKKISIENVGDTEAWVFYTYAVPTLLKDHIVVNFANNFAWIEQSATNNEIEVNGIKYTEFLVAYNAALAPKATTAESMVSVMLAKNIDAVDGKWVLVKNEDGTITTEETNWPADKAPIVYVNAYAIQTSGIEDTDNDGVVDVNDAIEAYIGQWGGFNGDHVVVVSSAEDLKDALAAGNDVVLAADVELDVAGKAMTVAADANITLDLRGHDIIGTTTASDASQVLFEVKGELTVVGDGTIALHDKSGAGFNQGYENAAIYVNGGVANLNEGMIVCTSSGEAMAYAADAVGGNSVINVNGATLYSSYIGIRSFPTASDKTNTINYNSGVVYGGKSGYDIWTQEGNGISLVNIADGIEYTYENQWGGMYYINIKDDVAFVSTSADLATAIANGGEVVLVDDVTVSEDTSIPVNGDVVIDLAGNTLTMTAGDNSAAAKEINVFTIGAGQTLTVEGGEFVVNFDKNGTNYADGNVQNNLFNVKAGGKLVINDGIFTATMVEEGYNLVPVIIDNNGEVEINGGSFKTNAINLFRNTNGKMTINGGTFTGTTYPQGKEKYPYSVIWNQCAKSVLTVNGGTFTNLEVEKEAGIVTIASGIDLPLWKLLDER